MSIIYDALKKVEKAHLHSPPLLPSKPPKVKLKNYLGYILLVCVGIFITRIIFALFIPKTTLTKPLPAENITALPQQILAPASPAPLEKSVPEPLVKKTAPALTLNGVFFSENQGYALINNRIVKEGEIIAGAQVKEIGLDGVELEIQGESVKLPSS